MGSNSIGSAIWEVHQGIQGTNLPDRCGRFAHCVAAKFFPAAPVSIGPLK
jgi:hypothetical protein